MLSPRWFHKINVAAVRGLNAPLLLLIAIIERRTLWSGAKVSRDVEDLPKTPLRPSLWRFSRGFSVHGDIQTVFDAEPPQPTEQEIANEDDLTHDHLDAGEFGPEISKLTTNNTAKSRRDCTSKLRRLRLIVLIRL